MNYDEEALRMHEKYKGKISIESKVSLKTQNDLSIAYTPGVAAPCLKIAKDPAAAYKYTGKGNFVAVVSDGSAVLGLGNIGGLAGLPVMEGKAVLFKELGGVNAFPICLATQDPQKVIDAIITIAPIFGGINLEDIKAPQCFVIEKKLREELDIPVFHDDQHGTAIVVLAALKNALKVVEKKIDHVRIVISGAGAAGLAITKLLLSAGAVDVIVIDSQGILQKKGYESNPYKQEIAPLLNPQNIEGGLKEAISGADVFIGVSRPGVLSKEMVASMAPKAIIFAMANPNPEILPEVALEAGAAIVGTGRSDYANQINNVLAFPGVFRGALDACAREINEEMKLAAAEAIASLVPSPTSEHIVPLPLDPAVALAVAKAVAAAAVASGVVRNH